MNNPFRIADSIEECSKVSDNPKLVVASTRCISALLCSLERISQGKGFNGETAKQILAMYERLSQSDYTGALSMSSMKKSPAGKHDFFFSFN